MTRDEAAQLTILALTVYREMDRVHPSVEEMTAIAYTLVNRAAWSLHLRENGMKPWWGDNVWDVATYPNQYSSMTFSGNRQRGIWPDKQLGLYPKLSDPLWQQCLLVAENVLSGSVVNPAPGATHYHADYVYPDWKEHAQYITKIGRHLFYFLRA